ncbi:MAG TPA: RDD family protein [Mycobacterium sp.]|nr:RDD family protein [Mycobacterium sp.]
MAGSFGSWLSGPPPVEPGAADQRPNDYPGQRLGLPQSGPKSLARMGRRIAALFIDWLIAYGLAALAMAVGLVSAPMLSTAVLVIWFVIGAVAVRLFGFTPGQFALGLVVVPVDNRLHVGFGRAVVRGILIALVIPALITDTDLRGLQDRLTFTAVVRR